MNKLARIALVLCSFALCAAGIVIAYHSADGIANGPVCDSDLFADEYKQVATAPERELAVSEFESIIRAHSTVKSHRGRIEFGSAKVKGATAMVEVFFFGPDGEMTPFFYKLTATKKSWKISAVQRMWFVPRSHLLRGLRV